MPCEIDMSGAQDESKEYGETTDRRNMVRQQYENVSPFFSFPTRINQQIKSFCVQLFFFPHIIINYLRALVIYIYHVFFSSYALNTHCRYHCVFIWKTSLRWKVISILVDFNH